MGHGAGARSRPARQQQPIGVRRAPHPRGVRPPAHAGRRAPPPQAAYHSSKARTCALPGGAAAAAAAVGAPSAPPPNAENALELRRALADAAMDTAYMGIDARRRLPQAVAAHNACAAVVTISASRVYSMKPCVGRVLAAANGMDVPGKANETQERKFVRTHTLGKAQGVQVGPRSHTTSNDTKWNWPRTRPPHQRGTHTKKKEGGGQHTGAAKSVPPDTKVPWASLTGAAEELKKR